MGNFDDYKLVQGTLSYSITKKRSKKDEKWDFCLASNVHKMNANVSIVCHFEEPSQSLPSRSSQERERGEYWTVQCLKVSFNGRLKPDNEIHYIETSTTSKVRRKDTLWRNFDLPALKKLC